MELKFVWVCLFSMFLSLEGCLQQERFALLQLRHFFNSPYYLNNWVDAEANSDCCQWERVECNNTTGRVISLDLDYMRNQDMGEWYLNASLFSAFEELESLNLEGNLIVDCVENGGFERLSHLSNVTSLILDDNLFNDSRTLSALSKLLSLKYLSLGSNQLRELNHFNVSSLNNLEALSLSGNIFDNDSILSSLTNLSSLKILSIDDIGLKGNVDFQELGYLRNLEFLAVGGQEIQKFIFPKGNTSLKRLDTIGLWNVSINDGSTLLQSLGSFPSLRSLDLFFVNFSGEIDTNCGEKGNLTNVKELLLDMSSLPVCLLSMFRSLESLDMYRCELRGVLTDKDYPNFNNLTYLDIRDMTMNDNLLQIMKPMTSLQTLSIYFCNLTGTLSDQDLPNFNNLKYLEMYETTIDDYNFSLIIKSMTSLQNLTIIGCNLTDTLSDQGICDLMNLKMLSLPYNNLKGVLPVCLANLTSLQVLDISLNNFTGDISSSPLKSLTSIQELRISDNHFQIPASFHPFFNHSKLKIFDGENNKIYVELGSHPLAPKFQLNSIILPGYRDGGSFPIFLYNQHELQEVDLSHANLTGEFPSWLLDNNKKLEKLLLANNSLSGPLQSAIHSHIYLKELDISKNFFYGHIPIEFGAYLPSLESLNASRNVFDGTIPSSLGEMKSLKNLDLSNNLLMGEIPEHLTVGCYLLQILILSNNSLQGHIFSTNFNLMNLMWLQLESNNFSGRIPDSLSKSSFLFGLYLSHNSLSGRLPSWLGNMTYLEDIVLDKNYFEGPIPIEFCQLDNLIVLDLSSNNINGYLPSCLQPLSIEQVHLSRNKLQGQLEGAFFDSSSLMTLDVQHNHFSGSIPQWIGRHSNLTYLSLSHNNFEGEIPIQLCQLHHLHVIDLSHNNLFGHIPSCLSVTAVPTNLSLPIIRLPNNFNDLPPLRKEEILEFATKKMSYSYPGRILSIFSGIDLSRNKLIGDIPYQIGNLIEIRTLNFSHNNLTGSIPSTFSNLRQLESMDLSYNNLIGKIPQHLVDLCSLAFFSVAHNNLSGRVPEWIAQFATFDEDSYEGNPLLCGQPLPKSCNTIDSPSGRAGTSTNNGDDGDFIDMNMFYSSFTISFIIALFGVIITLYINPYWRQAWFYLVETWMTSCYSFFIDYVFK